MYCRVLLGTAGSVCPARYCWVLQGIYWVLRVLCVLPGTAGIVGYRRVYTSYCRFCVPCRVLLGTAGYILGTVSSVCTAGYCWVLQGTAGYCRVYTGYCGFYVYSQVLLGTAGYRRVYTRYCGFRVYCRVLMGTAGYCRVLCVLSGTVGNVDYCG